MVGNSFLFLIKVVEPLSVLVGLKNQRLFVVDINTNPVIANVEVRNNRTIISGANFLSGAHLLLNGEGLGIAERSAENSGREIILNRGKKNLPSGVDLVIEVRNRDGLKSDPFTIEAGKLTN